MLASENWIPLEGIHEADLIAEFLDIAASTLRAEIERSETLQ